MAQTMGILLNKFTIRRGRFRSLSHEHLDLYDRCAKRLGVNLVYFHIDGVDLKNKEVEGYVWNPQTKRYKKIKTPIPAVIHNRMLTENSRTNEKIHELCELPDIRVFNPVINRNKLFLHEYLRHDEQIRPFLPETRSFTEKNLALMADKEKLYIKPTVGSIGRGIFIIKKLPEGGYLYQTASRKSGKIPAENLWEELRVLTSGRSYIIQDSISLARYLRRPFDLRVSVQKNEHDQWALTGIVGRVAPRGSIVTNMGRGGTAVPVNKLLRHAFPDLGNDGWQNIIRQITQLSLTISHKLEEKWPTLADIGLDIGLDTSGKPWFIEVNVRDQRYTFLSAGKKELFQRTYYNPIEYGRYLLTKG